MLKKPTNLEFINKLNDIELIEWNEVIKNEVSHRKLIKFYKK